MMIKSALNKLVQSIDPDQKLIQIAAVGLAKPEKPILLSVVSIEENRHLKNQSVGFSRTHFSAQPFVFSILFSTAQENYLDGIDKLQSVIAYLQQQQIFEFLDEDSDFMDELNSAKSIRFTLEPLSLTIEERAQLWTCLGAAYKPSVLYQLKFVG